MISIKNIAERCGVSTATVSKALNDHKDVSELTKKLVRETAKEMGYLPNSQARALKTNRTYNIGILYEDQSGNGLTQRYFSAVIDSFKVEIEKNGYDITFISSRSDDSLSYYEHCTYRCIDGALVACIDFYDKPAAELLRSELPLVTLDFYSDNKGSVFSDNKKGMEDIINYVCAMGHTKIAYIYGESSLVTVKRLDTFIQAMQKNGLTAQTDYARQARYHDPESVRLIVHDMLKLYEPPTCFVLPDDFAALGAMLAVDEAGLRIPEDISIAGYDGIDIMQIMKPSLVTIKQDTARIGRVAADLLIRQIKKENIPYNERHPVIEGKLLKGNSVRDIN